MATNNAHHSAKAIDTREKTKKKNGVYTWRRFPAGRPHLITGCLAQKF